MLALDAERLESVGHGLFLELLAAERERRQLHLDSDEFSMRLNKPSMLKVLTPNTFNLKSRIISGPQSPLCNPDHFQSLPCALG